ncbi:MAG: hypothetical protein JO013_11370 [Alphaproteobacteria bacterium]|nr:hypothetical protein [Alphaproteobacteria bacterium]
MGEAGGPELKVELLDVGHGDALLLHWQPASGPSSTILIDGGPVAGADRIATALQRLGATALDLAVLTHCDADHVDGLLAYARRDERLPIRRFWGPCLPAFRRHDWLFPPRVRRGLDQAEALQAALGAETLVSWPVEGATWTSADGDLTIRVLSPAARLTERLLLGDDAVSLFLERPTPLGWLLVPAEDVTDPEDAYADLRYAIGTGEIAPDRVPDELPSSEQLAPQESYAAQAEAMGVEPEFFGNSVLNDTSIVLLVEARLGLAQRRLLFTGDLENFTYLMARHPMGLGCDLVKVPHHGSWSFVDRDKAEDAVWQWLRPRAALVSANGKHGLPRAWVRDAALRWGATLFCTSRRSREVVSGTAGQSCCHAEYGCKERAQEPVSLSLRPDGIASAGVACARGNLSGAMPVIEVRQHVVEPSPILSTLCESEVRRHADWLVKWLRRTHAERRSRPAGPKLEPVRLDVLRQAAVAADRLAAATEIEKIAERAARDGRVWLSKSDRYRSHERLVWPMPDARERAALAAWIDRFALVQLAVKRPAVASAVEELLYAADTEWLAADVAERLLYPRAMFEDVLWPILVQHLLKTRSVGIRMVDPTARSFDAAVLIALFQGSTREQAAASLRQRLERLKTDEAIRDFLAASCRNMGTYERSSGLKWPEGLRGILPPLWLEQVLPPSGLLVRAWEELDISAVDFGERRGAVEQWAENLRSSYLRQPIAAELAPALLAALVLSNIEVVEPAPQSPPLGV